MIVMITSEEYKELVIKANKYDEMQEKATIATEGKHSQIEKVEIHKITPKEMGKILDDLKNKIIEEEN